jgi:hypothetical protein
MPHVEGFDAAGVQDFSLFAGVQGFRLPLEFRL